MCIDLVHISFLIVYTDLYANVETTYTPLYPHKNIQDDNENPSS